MERHPLFELQPIRGLCTSFYFLSPFPKNADKKNLLLACEKQFEFPCLNQLLNSVLPAFLSSLALLKSSGI